MKRWMLGVSATVLVVSGAAALAGGGWGAKAMDQDADGKVSKAEVVSTTLAAATALDLNKDGAVTVEEMQAFRAAKRAERQAAHMAKMDTNQDGKVSVEEIAALRAERLMQLDADGNGELSAEEMRGARHHGRHGGHHGGHHGGRHGQERG